MSNILIIKHGSLGDLIQANGAMEDIKKSFKDSRVFLLTTKPYVDLMSACPYLDGVITDKRLPRWNIFYLLKLKEVLDRFKFTHIFDLQNSSRTKFYQNFLIKNAIWSTTQTSLESGQTKKDFDRAPVLDRMIVQLNKSSVETKNTKKINLKWAFTDMNRIIKQHTNGDYVLVFPFCSKKHLNKKWPYFKELVRFIKDHYKNKYSVLVAPGPGELIDSKNLNAKVVLDGDKPIDLNQLISLIENSKYIISNDTGPAHICCHLDKKGIVLFGNHTTAAKVSIESSNFKSKTVNDLKDLKLSSVIEIVKENLD
jgi:ADP-heptose:LPS heptosyltransferase